MLVPWVVGQTHQLDCGRAWLVSHVFCYNICFRFSIILLTFVRSLPENGAIVVCFSICVAFHVVPLQSHTEADEEEKDGDCKDASDNIPTSSDEKPLNKNTADEKGEKGTLKHESGSSKDTVEKNSEKCSSEECKTLEKELEVDSKASGKVLANKDAKGQSNEI